jgi:hypothetical protein
MVTVTITYTEGEAPQVQVQHTMQEKLKEDPSNLRLVPTEVQDGNHEIVYKLKTRDGKDPKGKYYVFEHQTQEGGGRIKVGEHDYISPRTQDETNTFRDSITTGLDTVQRFTISTKKTFDPSAQTPVYLNYGGRDYGSQHIWASRWGGPVEINYYKTLPSFKP